MADVEPVTDGADARMPMWVRVFLIVGGLLIVGFLLFHFSGLPRPGH